jgi:hypothetical protein
LVEGVVVGVVAMALLGPSLAQRLAGFDPTCDDPAGRTSMSGADLTLQGDSHSKQYSVTKVVDGLPGTVWMPKSEGNEETSSLGDLLVLDDLDDRLIVKFGDGSRHNVQLVCIVNGIANEPSIYRNTAKVRGIRLTTDAGVRESTLRTFGDESFQNLQEVSVAPGSTDSLEIEIIDFQVGQYIETKNPARCNRDEVRKKRSVDWLVDKSGCMIAPQPIGGIAEIQLYVWDHSHEPYLLGPSWRAVDRDDEYVLQTPSIS